MIVDSSIWIEIFASGPLAKKCEHQIKNQNIQVPTLVLYEVYKKIKLQISEEQALEILAHISQFEIVELNREIALLAADLSIDRELAMADSIILATAMLLNTQLLTLDNDFVELPNTIVLRSNDD